MWIIGQKIFSDKNILPIKTANIFGKQYFTNKHVLAGVEKKNKHNDVGWTNGKITFKMSSAKIWLWARYLPECLTDKIPAFSEH
jgi:hypothetical protein